MALDTAPLVASALGAKKAVIGGEIINKTLDAMNKTAPTCGKGKFTVSKDPLGADKKTPSGEESDWQKSVLSSVYSPKGAIASMKG